MFFRFPPDTLDELFEILTLVQSHKTRSVFQLSWTTKNFGTIIDCDLTDPLRDHQPEDVDLFHRTDSVDHAYMIYHPQIDRIFDCRPGAVL